MRLPLLVCFFFLSLYSSAQNVGLGTTTPQARLHVKGTGGGTQIILEENAGSILRISNEANAAGPYIGTTSNHSFSLVSNNAVRMVVAANGNVGVGITNPQQLLSVSGGMVIDQNNLNAGTSANMLSFGSSSGEGIGSKRNAGTGQFGLDFYTSNILRMKISNNGRVGIGTNNPGATLDVNGDLNVQNRILINNSAGNSRQVLVSNGTEPPSWESVAYSNIDRFYYKTDTGIVSSLPQFLSVVPRFRQVYAHSAAITQSSLSNFNVNKSGLYSIILDLSISATKSAANSNGILLMDFYITFPSTPTYRENFYSGPMDYVGLFPGGHVYTKNVRKEWKIYMPAGTSFSFFTTGISSNVVSCNLDANTGLSINLISE